jgi:branched-chain amino acid transport system permease protein
MVSLGHAAFFGAGAYVAAICMDNGLRDALLAFPLAMIVAGLLALVVGAISLRTRGVYFIMITLAFAQMTYYLFVSARVLGGDDGLPLTGRMTLGGLGLNGDGALFYMALGCLALVMFLLGRLADARFGRTIQAIRENETRMEALGYPVFRYRLVCFALGGALAGLAGALLANLTGLASPNLLQWTQSGTLLVMVIIGGVGYLYGGPDRGAGAALSRRGAGWIHPALAHRPRAAADLASSCSLEGQGSRRAVRGSRDG